MNLVFRSWLTWACLCGVVKGQKTVYEYFSENEITSGLEANNRDHFVLNERALKIFSGSLHYFRVHPDYWQTRLRQYRAAGLNTIDVYVPWNLHEPEKDVFDFGDGGRDFSPFLNITRFLEMAKEEDLFVIFRPGPYICGEWEFGGMPSWLLHEHPMFLRTTHSPYQERVEIFLHEVISRVKDLQFFTVNGRKGGPIIMTQIENEYGNFGYGDYPRDKPHLTFIESVLKKEGIESLLFTSDSPLLVDDYGNIPSILMTANFKYNSIENLDRLVELQPNRPILVSEYWPGWFDHWFEQVHNTLSEEAFAEILGNIFAYNGSVNFYMFHGGTNFGFMNGANWLSFQGVEVWPHYAPDVTSYDYNAPLTESGNYTSKYFRAVEMIAAYDPLATELIKPELPVITPPTVYMDVQMTEYLDYNAIIDNVPLEYRETSNNLKSMEELSLNNNNGQSYGYIVYRKKVSLKKGSQLLIRGFVRDLLQVLVNGVMLNEPIVSLTDIVNFGSWTTKNTVLTIDTDCDTDCTLDLFVENLGRANFGQPHQFNSKKGLWEGPIILDGVELMDWEIIPLEFKGKWVNSLTGWQPYVLADNQAYRPRVVKGNLLVEGQPRDTFFDYDCSPDCESWLHGAVFVNGFNIGRYYQAGPQKTLYIPGPLLMEGDNQIVVMENYLGSDILKFTDTPNYGPSAQQHEITVSPFDPAVLNQVRVEL